MAHDDVAREDLRDGCERWSLVRFVPVAAAMGWVRGQLLLSAVVLPVLRRGALAARSRPAHSVGDNTVARVANVVMLPAIVVTGFALAWHRGVTLSSLGDPGYARTLGVKITLLVVALALAATHGSLARARARVARPLAVSGLMVSLEVVVFATALVP